MAGRHDRDPYAVALLGLYLLAWQRHSRRHSPGHWLLFRQRRFNTLGDDRERATEHGRNGRGGNG